MTCTNPEISDQILAWLDGALSPSEAERFRMHVESCPSCQAAARDLSDLTKRVSRAYAAQRQAPLASACPSAEDLIDFASGTTPPRRAAGIERHLAVCEPCREQVEGLAELDATPAADIGDAPRMPTALRDAFRAAHPARVATPTADEAARPSVPSAAMTPRPGGGRGWGMRRILAAVATFTVIIGVSTLLLVRPDMFGARPTESDEVRQSVSPSRSIPERTLDVEPGTAGAPPRGHRRTSRQQLRRRQRQCLPALARRGPPRAPRERQGGGQGRLGARRWRRRCPREWA